MDKRDQIATAAFVFVGVAGGIAMMAAPVLFDVSGDVAWWLFWGGLLVGVAALITGLKALFRRADPAASATIDQSVTSHNQSGGITTHTININDGRQ